VDTVTRQLERLLDRIPANRIFACLYNGFIPRATLMKTIELFHSKVLPRVTGQELVPVNKRACHPFAKFDTDSSVLTRVRLVRAFPGKLLNCNE
jgi:hypothetical protein